MPKAGVFKLGESGLDVSPLEQQREFSYQIKIYDRTLTNKVAEIASGIKNVTLESLNFGFLQDGGCADFSFALGEEFTQATIGYNYRVELCFYNQPNPWYQGFITKLPESGTDKKQTYSGYGYAKQLSWIRIDRKDLAQEVHNIIRTTIDYVVANTDIVKDADKLATSIYPMVSNIYWDKIPANDLFERLRQLAGSPYYEWGVDEERDFYFRAINTNVLENFWIGKHLDAFKGTEDPDSIRNRLYVKCGRLTDGSDYTLQVPDTSIEPTTSQNAFGLREEVVVAPEIWPTFSATDLANGIAIGAILTDPVGSNKTNAVDANPANYWDSDNAQNIGNSIRLDLGVGGFAHIARVVLDSTTALAKEQFARGFSIRISMTTGGLALPAALVFTSTALSTNNPDIRFTPIRGRYVLITLTANDTEHWHLGEVKVYQLDTSDIRRWANYILDQKKIIRKKATLTIKGINELIEKKHIIKPFKPYGKWGIYAEDGTHIEDYQVKSVKYSLSGNSFDMSAELGQLERESVPAAFKKTLQRLEEYNMSGVRSSDDLASGIGNSPLSILRTMIGKEQIETPHLVAGAVTTDILRALSVIASKISVTDLVDIANLLTVAAGRITIGANILGAGRDGILIVDDGAVRRVEIGEIAAGVYGANFRDADGVLVTDAGEVTQRWRKIYETVITVACNSFVVPNVDGDADIEYLIRCYWVSGGPAATQIDYVLRPNSDALLNYRAATIYVLDGAVGQWSGNDNHFWLGRNYSTGEVCQGDGTVKTESGHMRTYIGTFSMAVRAAGTRGGATTFCGWTNIGANITTFLLASHQGLNGIGIDSRIEIWKRVT